MSAQERPGCPKHLVYVLAICCIIVSGCQVSAAPYVEWRFDTGGSLHWISAAVGPDGTVYVTSNDGNLYALSPAGSLEWSFVTGGMVCASPTVQDDGTIYVGTEDGLLYAMNPNGSEKWRYQMGGGTGACIPALAADGAIYVGSRDHHLYAISKSGTLSWRMQAEDQVLSSPAIAGDGTIYVGSDDGGLYRVRPDGSVAWRFGTGGDMHASPAIGEDGTIYTASWDGYVYAVNPDGSRKWRFLAGGRVDCNPALGADGTVYIGSDSANVYALNPDGTEKWRFGTGSRVWSSPSIGSDGTVYVNSGPTLYALRTIDGTPRWSWSEPDSSRLMPPTIGPNGRVYVGAENGRFYALAFTGELPQLANTSWPMFHHDVRHSGRYAHNGGAAPVIASVNPAAGGNSGLVTVAISGQHLNPFAQVRLVRTGWEDVVAIGTGGGKGDGTELVATLNIRGRPSGIWDLVVKNLDGQEVSLPGGFAIVSGGGPQLCLSAIGPFAMRVGRTVTYVIEVRNDGPGDAYDVVACVRVPLGIEVDLDGRALTTDATGPLADEVDGAMISSVLIPCVPAGSAATFSAHCRCTDASAGAFALGLGAFLATDALYPGTWEGATSAARGGRWCTPSTVPVVRAAGGDWGEGYVVYAGPGANPMGHDAFCTYDSSSRRAVWDQWMAWEARRDPGNWPSVYAQRDGPVPYDLWAAKIGTEKIKGAVPLPGWTASTGLALTAEAGRRILDVERLAPYDRLNRVLDGVKHESCSGFIADVVSAVTGRYIPYLTPGAQWVYSGGAFADFYHGQTLWEGVWAWTLGKSGYTRYLRELVDLAQVLPYLLISPVTSSDPNYKSGPAGFGASRWVARDHAMGYMVHYENDPEKATAAAAEVHISDQLDPNLDWTTYQITGIQVAGVDVPVDAGAQAFTKTVSTTVKLKDLNDPSYPNCAPQDVAVDIEVKCEFDAPTGLAKWSFVGHKPGTGEVTDFLPPNEFEDDPGTAWDDIVAPQGEGWVSYSCAPKSDVVTGTQISNVAEIVFDTNPPMRTDATDGPWVNTIDAGAPSSAVTASAVSAYPSFKVSWSGEDDTNGSGIGSYDVYVSDNGGAYTRWLSGTTDTSGSYSGETDHEYRFYSRARDNAGNLQPEPDSPDATVVVQNPTLSHDFAAGVCMMSVPLEPTQPDPKQCIVFGGNGWARWDPSAAKYVGYGADPGHFTWFDAPATVPGKGYWARFDADATVCVIGAPSAGTEYAVNVDPGSAAGWVQIGCPWAVDVPWSTSTLQVRSGSETKTLAEAKAAGWCEDFAWGYKPGSGGGYELVADPTGSTLGQRDKLEPWQGYWFLVYRPCELVIPVPTSGAASGKQVRAKDADGDWRFGIEATAESGVASRAVLGQAKTPVVIQAPPPFEEPVRVHLLASDQPAAVELKDASLPSTWALEATTPGSGTQVKLTWPDLSRVPNSVRVYLVDEATGARRYMRTTEGYTYKSAKANETRRFRVEAKPADGSGLAITSAVASAGGGAASVAFTLSAPASVSVSVRNIAGRVVCDVAQDKACDAGTTTLSFDGRSTRGTRLPGGRYLVEVIARADDGQQVSRVVALEVRR